MGFFSGIKKSINKTAHKLGHTAKRMFTAKAYVKTIKLVKTGVTAGTKLIHRHPELIALASKVPVVGAPVAAGLTALGQYGEAGIDVVDTAEGFAKRKKDEGKFPAGRRRKNWPPPPIKPADKTLNEMNIRRRKGKLSTSDKAAFKRSGYNVPWRREL